MRPVADRDASLLAEAIQNRPLVRRAFLAATDALGIDGEGDTEDLAEPGIIQSGFSRPDGSPEAPGEWRPAPGPDQDFPAQDAPGLDLDRGGFRRVR